MTISLVGRLARRGRSPAGNACPMDRAMQVVGTRSAVLLMREACYGTTRFDDFVGRTGLTEATAAGRLRELVEAGLLDRESYREPGQRTRSAYVLTRSGRELGPALLALGQWAERYVPDDRTPKFVHGECGEPMRIVITCGKGHKLELDDISVTG